MRTHTRSLVAVLVISVVGSGVALALASIPDNGAGNGVMLAKQGPPPGHAKKGGVPPGLAKKFGPTVPAKAYIAIDPRYDDRAYFLIGGNWVLMQDFDSSVRVEVRSLMTLPPIPEPPPVPLPSVAVGFHIVLFS